MRLLNFGVPAIIFTLFAIAFIMRGPFSQVNAAQTSEPVRNSMTFVGKTDEVVIYSFVYGGKEYLVATQYRGGVAIIEFKNP